MSIDNSNGNSKDTLEKASLLEKIPGWAWKFEEYHKENNSNRDENIDSNCSSDDVNDNENIF